MQLRWQSARLACERYRDRYPASPGRDSIGVSTSRCGRDDPGSNPGHGIFCENFLYFKKSERSGNMYDFQFEEKSTKIRKSKCCSDECCRKIEELENELNLLTKKFNENNLLEK